MIETYIVIAPLPIKSVKVGSIIEVTTENLNIINFSDTKFFKKYIKPLYDKGQKVYISKNKQVHYILNEPTLNAKGEWVYTVSESPYPNNVRFSSSKYEVTEKNIKPSCSFWFINSNGIICEDFENRPGLNKEGLHWKKSSGNFFPTKAAAQAHKDSFYTVKFNANLV